MVSTAIKMPPTNEQNTIERLVALRDNAEEATRLAATFEKVSHLYRAVTCLELAIEFYLQYLTHNNHSDDDNETIQRHIRERRADIVRIKKQIESKKNALRKIVLIK
ncbi:ac120 [Hemileuca sp. nucleopolyhedrovirus]|uniref:Ac120 n=1 Tax=Hemileuca sp. nucleopolyhedrovirus TaxID=1367203 RepID=S5MQC8_9ABAC|nr:ac120 [Hemileuca sp. nucleopolyhedrovirus]AGR56873.1 ac120 [Hemileuca sp. nucleopolyhedrovirus]